MPSSSELPDPRGLGSSLPNFLDDMYAWSGMTHKAIASEIGVDAATLKRLITGKSKQASHRTSDRLISYFKLTNDEAQNLGLHVRTVPAETGEYLNESQEVHGSEDEILERYLPDVVGALVKVVDSCSTVMDLTIHLTDAEAELGIVATRFLERMYLDRPAD